MVKRLFYPSALFSLFALVLGFPHLIQAQECGVVYVTPTGASSGAAGTKANPANLVYGLSLANPQNHLVRVAVGNYTITDALVMKDSIVVEGGYLPLQQWARTNKDSTVITRTSANMEANPNRIVGIKCENLKNFRIKDLRLVVQNVASGVAVSTYGIYLNSCKNYTISRVWVRTGRGTNGIDGVNGSNGADGADGGDGGLGSPFTENLDPISSVPIPNIPLDPGPTPYTVNGGAGGQSWSGGANAGGAGGAGGLRGFGTNCLPAVDCPANSNPCDPANGPIGAPDGSNGISGFGPNPGPGGPGKAGYNFCAFNTGDQQEIIDYIGSCPSQDTAVYRGSDGTDGGNGLAGTSGVDGVAQFVGGFWIPQDGTDGTDGQDGGGGGGGGGGASIGGIPQLGTVPLVGTPTLPNLNTAGGGGGGGGEGGQKGTKGTKGTAAGSSFAIFVWNNGPNGVIKDCNLRPGKAGVAGKGGNKGKGGFGGDGGKSGSDVLYGVGPYAGNGTGCKGGAGGAGGDGGNGGDGGRGGNGTAGVSLKIWEDTLGQPVFLIDQFNPFEVAITVSSNGCANNTITATADVGTSVYNWFLNGNPSSAIGQTVTTEYTNSGFQSIAVLVDGVPFGYSDFIYLDKPFVQPKIIASTPTICAGSSVNFTTTAIGDQYIWKFPGGNITTSSAQNPGNVTFSTPGLYNIEIQTISCCGASRIDTLKLNVLNSVSVNLPPSDTICKLDTPYPLLNATALPGAIYTWKLDGTSLPATTPTLQTTVAGTYEVTVTYGPGCIGTDSYLLATFDSLYVNLGPDVQLCGDDIPPLLNPNVDGISYIWMRNGQIVYTGAQYQVVIPGNYSVKIVSQFGCYGYDDIKITRSQPLVLLGLDRTICPKLGFNTLDAGNPGATYEWKLNGSFLASTQKINATLSGSYSVIVTDSLGCQGKDTVFVNLANILTADFNAPSSVKVGETVNFLDNSQPDQNLWAWNFGDGVLSNVKNPTHTFNEPGLKPVFLIVGNGFCADTIIKYIDVLNDCSTLNLSADFGFPSDTVDLNTSGLVSFTNQSQNATEYFWDFGNSQTSGLKDPSTSYATTGSYQIKMVARNYNCSDSITKTIVVVQISDTTSGRNDVLDGQKINVYPNPFSNDIYIQAYSEGIQFKSDVVVTTLQGQIVYQKAGEILTDEPVKLDFSHLSKGVYLLQITSPKSTVVHKIIKN